MGAAIKSKIITSISNYALGFIFISSLSCKGIGTPTPPEFKHTVTVPYESYKKDLLTLYDSISVKLFDKKEPFHSVENDSLTEIFIDTILYSPQMNRIAFFVISKNSNDKLLSGGNKDEFHFDAHCFLANYRKGRVSKIIWQNNFNVINYHDYYGASNRIKEFYFFEFNSIKDSNDESYYKYNLDDIRFWDGPCWSKDFINITRYESE